MHYCLIIELFNKRPTTPDVIIKYLHFYASVVNSRTLTRRLTALKNWHVYQGFNNPVDNSLVHKTLIGIKNIHGKPKEKASALTIEDLIVITNYLKSIMKQSRWQSSKTVLGYIEEGKLFEENAAKVVLKQSAK